MAITAFLANGDEVQVNGPLLLMADDGQISVSATLFSCAQNGKYIKIPLEKLREASFPTSSISEVDEIMSSELPSVKFAWERLRGHLNTQDA